MLPTPSTSHVDVSRIYDPAEDTFLLIDTLSSDAECAFLKARFAAPCPIIPLVLEVGTGSGVVLAFVTQFAEHMFGRPDVMTLGLDINEHACKATVQTIGNSCNSAQRDGQRRPALSLGVLQGDLTAACKPGVVDVLVFNPPYVPTPGVVPLQRRKMDEIGVEGLIGKGSDEHARRYEEDSRLLELSYAGGKDGMEVTARLLEQIPGLLSARGVAYVLLCEGNKPDAVKASIRTWGGEWAAETVGRSGKRAGWEKLQVIRIWRV